MILPSIEQKIREHLRYNFIVNLMDGAFFGFAIGFSSFTTVIPLFVSRFTNSAILIGLIPAIHSVGWQFPQLLTASWVSRLRRYKPAVITLTSLERIPFLGLAAVAWFSPILDKSVLLMITFVLLIWQGLGGGFTANGWTNLLTKIIPAEIRGTFFGAQAAAANAMASASAVTAGILLNRLNSPYDFTMCFLLTFVFLVVSWIFLALTREPEGIEQNPLEKPKPFSYGIKTILHRDKSFRWFLLSRILTQFATMGFAFYIVYAVRQFQMDEVTAGIMTGIYMFAQIIANPLLGFLGDRWSNHRVMELGTLAAALSAALAWKATSLIWFYSILILAALGVVSIWTIGIAMTVKFGSDSERPIYIGLANTLVAPATIIAPIIGGWLADSVSYQVMFLVTAICGIATTLVLHFGVREPTSKPQTQ